jgi:hypothetical protein
LKALAIFLRRWADAIILYIGESLLETKTKIQYIGERGAVPCRERRKGKEVHITPICISFGMLDPPKYEVGHITP